MAKAQRLHAPVKTLFNPHSHSCRDGLLRLYSIEQAQLEAELQVEHPKVWKQVSEQHLSLSCMGHFFSLFIAAIAEHHGMFTFAWQEGPP